jgi:hypothetical protein
MHVAMQASVIFLSYFDLFSFLTFRYNHCQFYGFFTVLSITITFWPGLENHHAMLFIKSWSVRGLIVYTMIVQAKHTNQTFQRLFCLFVYSRTSNFSAIWRLSLLPVTGLQILVYARRSRPLSMEGSLCATPTATRNLGLYCLIQKTSTQVPQWDLNSWRKDNQIIAPNALTTAPHRQPKNKD